MSAAPLLRSAHGRYCAQVPVGDRLEIYGLTSAGNSDTRKLVGRSANERTRGWQPRENAAGNAAGEKKLGEKQRAVAVDLYRQMKHTIDETARRLASRGQRLTSILRRLALSDIGSKHVTILFRCGIPPVPGGRGVPGVARRIVERCVPTPGNDDRCRRVEALVEILRVW